MTLKAVDDYPFIAARLKQFEAERKAAQLRTVENCPLHLHPLIVTSVYYQTLDARATAGDFETSHSFNQYKEWLRGLTPQQITTFAMTGYSSGVGSSSSPDARRLRTENMKVLMARLSRVLPTREFAAL